MTLLVAYVEDDNKTLTRLHIHQYNDQYKGKIVCAYGHRLIAKRGDKKMHHYAHQAGEGTDCVHENKGEWHVEMQSHIEDDCVEVPIADPITGRILHIADVLCDGRVIEFQKSPMSQTKMGEREDFYTRTMGYTMCWVFCCVPGETGIVIKTTKIEGNIAFMQWISGSKFPLWCNMQNQNLVSYLDLGTMDLFEILAIKGAWLMTRIVRLSVFEKEWYGSHSVKPSQTIWERHPTYAKIQNDAQQDVQSMKKAFYKPKRR